eukprot:362245-Chlamydomonas_euryale.AAC.7
MRAVQRTISSEGGQEACWAASQRRMPLGAILTTACTQSCAPPCAERPCTACMIAWNGEFARSHAGSSACHAHRLLTPYHFSPWEASSGSPH